MRNLVSEGINSSELNPGWQYQPSLTGAWGMSCRSQTLQAAVFCWSPAGKIQDGTGAEPFIAATGPWNYWKIYCTYVGKGCHGVLSCIVCHFDVIFFGLAALDQFSHLPPIILVRMKHCTGRRRRRWLRSSNNDIESCKTELLGWQDLCQVQSQLKWLCTDNFGRPTSGPPHIDIQQVAFKKRDKNGMFCIDLYFMLYIVNWFDHMSSRQS